MIPFVPGVVPSILQALLIVCVLCVALSKQIKAHPKSFYLLVGLASAATFVPAARAIPAAWMVIQVFASCYTGVAIYLAVMFAGALPKKWQVTKRLLFIRSEMSIAGGFVILAHCIRVVFMVPLSFSAYWEMIWAEAALPMLVACGIVGPLLLACFLVPWVTSFPFARKRMSFATWKKTQKLAYPFMALLVLQGFFLAVGHGMYVGPAGADFVKYAATAVTYLAIGVAYLALKALGVGAKPGKEKEDA